MFPVKAESPYFLKKKAPFAVWCNAGAFNFWKEYNFSKNRKKAPKRRLFYFSAMATSGIEKQIDFELNTRNSFWNRSKTLTRLEEEFETSDVFRVIYSNNWNLFSSQFIVKYLLSSFPFWITAKMKYDWRKVVKLSNKFEER